MFMYCRIMFTYLKTSAHDFPKNCSCMLETFHAFIVKKEKENRILKKTSN